MGRPHHSKPMPKLARDLVHNCPEMPLTSQKVRQSKQYSGSTSALSCEIIRGSSRPAWSWQLKPPHFCTSMPSMHARQSIIDISANAQHVAAEYFTDFSQGAQCHTT